MLAKWSYWPPSIVLSIELEWLAYSTHVVQSLFKTCRLYGVHSHMHTTHI
jgi:hypothetical protein